MPTSQGTAHVYGVAGTITNATVISMDLTDVHLNRGEVVDEQGNQIERRYDDLSESGTITLRYQSGYVMTDVAAAISISNGIASNTYEVTERGKPMEAQGFRQVTYSVLRSSNITSA